MFRVLLGCVALFSLRRTTRRTTPSAKIIKGSPAKSTPLSKLSFRDIVTQCNFGGRGVFMAGKKNAIEKVPAKRKPFKKARECGNGKNVKDADDWRDGKDEHCPERILWMAVILQAMQDFSSRSRKRVEEVSKMNARAWLFRRNKDFDNVCEMAGLDPEFTRQHLKIRLDEDHPLRSIRRKRRTVEVDKITRASVERSPRRPPGNLIGLSGVTFHSPYI